MTGRAAQFLLSVLLAAGAVAGELPGERLGRPLRVHVARGLWWQMLRLHDAIGLIGGAELSSSVDVYGHPTGYHGCARAMGTFPLTRERLAQQDIIVLAGSRVAALPEDTQTALLAWVRAGGGLLITGGPLSLDCDRYGPLAAALPVELVAGRDLVAANAAVLRPAEGSGLEGFDWSAGPRVYWVHARVSTKADARVLLHAGDVPVLATGELGKGTVAVFSATVCGAPAWDETAFWDWPDWPRVLSAVLADLAPAAPVALPAAEAPRAELAAALERLEQIRETGLDFLDSFLDEPGEAEHGGADSVGAELTELARLAGDAGFASAVVRAAAGSNARLSLAQGATIFDAVAPHVEPEVAAQCARDLMGVGAPGSVALGLRLAGLARTSAAGPDMVSIVAGGLSALPSRGADADALVDAMRVPDGKDEGLRLAAAEALADLANPELAAPLRQAGTRWQRERNRTPTLADRQRDVDEMVMAALAAMGETEAAASLVARVIDNCVAREAALDLSEHALRNPTPEDIRRRDRAREDVVRLAARNRRLYRVLRRLPPDAWPGLAARAASWRGEFAAEALLLALAAGREGGLSSLASEALARIGRETPVEAVRRLCESRRAATR